MGADCFNFHSVKTFVYQIENKVYFIWRYIRMYFTYKWVFCKKNILGKGDFASYTSRGKGEKMIIQKSFREKKDILFNMVEYILQEGRELLYIFLKISSCI